MMFDVADGNYVPFKTIVPYLRGQPTWIVAIYNIGGNVVSFIPLGFFVPILYRRPLPRLKQVLIFAFILSLALELMQVLFQSGVFDIDDIILNVLSAIVGYGAFILVAPLLQIDLRHNDKESIKLII